MNEAQTRTEHVEPVLRASGWRATSSSKILREHRITEGRKEGAKHRSPAEIASFTLYFSTREFDYPTVSPCCLSTSGFRFDQ